MGPGFRSNESRTRPARRESSAELAFGGHRRHAPSSSTWPASFLSRRASPAWKSGRWPCLPWAKDLAKLARKGLKTMGNFALLLPFARPRYRLFKGRMEHLQRRTSKAQRSFRKGLELAERSGFAWDEGLIHLEMVAPSRPQARLVPPISMRRVDRSRGWGKPPRPGQSDGAGRLAVHREVE